MNAMRWAGLEALGALEVYPLYSATEGLRLDIITGGVQLFRLSIDEDLPLREIADVCERILREREEDRSDDSPGA
jgi:hypothetical protein